MAKRSKINLAKANDYEARGSHWLAEGNAAAERGNREKAERCYEKSQRFLDRANEARGWNDPDMEAMEAKR